MVAFIVWYSYFALLFNARYMITDLESCWLCLAGDVIHEDNDRQCFDMNIKLGIIFLNSCRVFWNNNKIVVFVFVFSNLIVLLFSASKNLNDGFLLTVTYWNYDLKYVIVIFYIFSNYYCHLSEIWF